MKQTTWLSPELAALWLGVKIDNVRKIAEREQWRKQRKGRNVEYNLDDIDATHQARVARQTKADVIH